MAHFVCPPLHTDRFQFRGGFLSQPVQRGSVFPTPCNLRFVFLAYQASSEVCLSHLVAAGDCDCPSSGNLVSLLPRVLDAYLCSYKPNIDRSYILRRLESFGTKSLDVRNTFFRHCLVNT